MRHMAHVVGALVVAAVPAMAFAAPIVINSGDIAWDPNGYDVRIQYDTASDGYYLNNNHTSAFISGYAAGLSGSYRAARNVESSGTSYLSSNSYGNDWVVFTWTFDFSSTGTTIQSATVVNPTLANSDGSVPTTVYWQVTANGVTTNYQEIASNNNGGTSATDGGVVHDLTAYVAGATSYSITAVWNQVWDPTTPQILRSNITYGFDNQVWLNAVPEPASIGILAICGLTLLGARRSRQ